MPVFNEDAMPLVQQLAAQAASLAYTGLQWNIIISDDASTTHTGWLIQAQQMHGVTVLRAERNMGRAANRNCLAQAAFDAGAEWLLFVDAGNQPASDDFIRNFLNAATDNNTVVCATCCVDGQRPPRGCELRWRYERAAETNTDDKQAFRSAAFLIHAQAMRRIAFDTTLRGYGYEDVLFGAELRRAGYTIRHIPNAVRLGNIETNQHFLNKTEESLHTLNSIAPRIGDESRLLNIARRLRRLHLVTPCAAAYTLAAPLLRRQLLSHSPSLRLFATYKLGFFLNLKHCDGKY